MRAQLETEAANAGKEVDDTKDEADDLKEEGTAPLPVQPKPTPMTTFTSLGISSPLRAALKSMSITDPTEVQSACIPPILSGVFLFVPHALQSNRLLFSSSVARLSGVRRITDV